MQIYPILAVAYVTGDPTGEGIEGRIDLTQGSSAGAGGVFIPNDNTDFVKRLTQETTFITFHCTSSSSSTANKVFQAVVQKPENKPGSSPTPPASGTSFIIDPMSVPQTGEK